jgi:2-keto-4-pentenoate hydratase/2-oxohepta-3-ene-1,7-dioic acid hydratase in catechol pathway
VKIARWLTSSGIGEGFVVEGELLAFAGGATVAEVLKSGLGALPGIFQRSEGGERVALADAELLAPIVPASIRDFVAFEEHVEGMTAGPDGEGHVPTEWYEAPTFYFTNPHTVLGPTDPVLPPTTERLDYELEVAVVIGGDGGKNLDTKAADESIFGYTIMNDWSARDLQFREMAVRLGPAKGKDFGTSLGPWIVTADEVSPYLDADGFLALRGEAWVNGVLIGEDLLSNMGWPLPVLVAYASRNSRVVPGDVLGSGTFGNGGCLGELWGRRGGLTPPPLQQGDEVRLVVEGIGELKTVVDAPREVPSLPSALPRSRARSRVGYAQ